MEVNGVTTGRMAGYGATAVANAVVPTPEAAPTVAAVSQSVAVNTDVPSESMMPQGKENQGAKMIDSEEAEKITKALNQFMSEVNTDLHFSLHQKTNTLMAQFVDEKNAKVVKEFPAHELLDVVGRIRELVGAFLDKKV